MFVFFKKKILQKVVSTLTKLSKTVKLAINMKITISPYNPDWINQFEILKTELAALLKAFNPTIEHFGSTSIPDLAAKPIIDVMVGVSSTDSFDAIVKNMLTNEHYIYYQCYNVGMPDRRLFVRLKKELKATNFPNTFPDSDNIPHEAINHLRHAHVHVWELGSANWIRHIAFRDYLKVHPDIRKEYEILKKKLSGQDWKDGNEYNQGKDTFIKREEAKAVAWYTQRR